MPPPSALDLLENVARLAQQGRIDKAIAACTVFLEKVPDEPRVLQKLTELQLRSGDALKACHGMLRLAQLHANRGFASKAIAVYRQALRLVHDDDATSRLAELLAATGQVGEAIEVLSALAARTRTAQARAVVWRKALELDPGFTLARVSLGETLQEAGDAAGARTAFKAAAERLRRDGHVSDYLRVAEKLWSVSGDDPVLGCELAASLVGLGHPREALRILKPLLVARPDDTFVLDLLADAFTALQQTEKAVATLRSLAHSCSGQGREAETGQAWLKLLRLAPQDPEARLELFGGPEAGPQAFEDLDVLEAERALRGLDELGAEPRPAPATTAPPAATGPPVRGELGDMIASLEADLGVGGGSIGELVAVAGPSTASAVARTAAVPPRELAGAGLSAGRRAGPVTPGPSGAVRPAPPAAGRGQAAAAVAAERVPELPAAPAAPAVLVAPPAVLVPPPPVLVAPPAVLVAPPAEAAAPPRRLARVLALGGRVAVLGAGAAARRLVASLADAGVEVLPPPPRERACVPAELLEMAAAWGAGAIAPATDELACSPMLAQACEAWGISLLGPGPEAVPLLASRRAARRRVQAGGLPVVEGTTIDDLEGLRRALRELPGPARVVPDGPGLGSELPADGDRVRAATLARMRAAPGPGATLLEPAGPGSRVVIAWSIRDRAGVVTVLGLAVLRAIGDDLLALALPNAEGSAAVRSLAAEVTRAVATVGLCAASFRLDPDGNARFDALMPPLSGLDLAAGGVRGIDCAVEALRISQGAEGGPLPAPEGACVAVRLRRAGEAPHPPGGEGVRVELATDEDGFEALVATRAPDLAALQRRFGRVIRELGAPELASEIGR